MKSSTLIATLCLAAASTQAMEDPSVKARLLEFTSKIERNQVDLPWFKEGAFMHIPRYRRIQPDFVDAVLTSPDAEVLELGPGKGFVLEDILLKQDETHKFIIKYTGVDTSDDSMAALAKVFTKYTKLGKKVHLKRSNKSMLDFLNGKVDMFDLVFAGFSLHVLEPMSHTAALNLLFTAMKEGGRLFMTQQSCPFPCGKDSAKQYPPTYIKELEQGNIYPFSWRNEAGQEYFMSDPLSMQALLNAAGFRIETCGLYEDYHVEGRVKTNRKYLGMIVVKDSSLTNTAMLIEYAAKAGQVSLSGGKLMPSAELADFAKGK